MRSVLLMAALSLATAMSAYAQDAVQVDPKHY